MHPCWSTIHYIVEMRNLAWLRSRYRFWFSINTSCYPKRAIMITTDIVLIGIAIVSHISVVCIFGMDQQDWWGYLVLDNVALLASGVNHMMHYLLNMSFRQSLDYTSAPSGNCQTFQMLRVFEHASMVPKYCHFLWRQVMNMSRWRRRRRVVSDALKLVWCSMHMVIECYAPIVRW